MKKREAVYNTQFLIKFVLTSFLLGSEWIYHFEFELLHVYIFINSCHFAYVLHLNCFSLILQVIKAVNELYHQFNAHQQPFVFLNIFSSRDAVDVNVTPDKRQVFLEHEKLLVATVKVSN